MTKHKKTEQNRHQRLIRWRKVLSVLSMVVVSVTTYALILPAITSSTQTWCGLEEHTHDDSCYEQRLVCGLEEGAMTTILLDAGHKHSDACYEMRQVLVCGQTEREPNEAEHDPGHIHTEACYETKRVLTCGEVEHEPVTEEMTAHHHTEACYERVLCCTKSEHTHEELCYSNPNQIETPEQWELELPLEERSGVWADDLLLIANSQLGFRESEENYTLIDGERQGYTRFGDWYGQRYGNWNATFVSFCLSYADIPERFVPYASEAADWVDTLQEQGLYRMRQEDENGQPVADYLPKKGDLVFFADEESESKSPVRVGIVQDLSVEDDETRLITVEGDADGEVASCSYELNAAAIVGFAELPERPEWLAAFQTTGRAPAAAPTEPQNEEENDTAKAGPSFNNAANVLRGADRNTLRFQGRDFEILAQYPDNAEIPEGAWLAVTELTKNDAAYAEHAQEAAAQLTEDQELTYARFFDIRIMNAEGEEVELANDAEVKVEIRLLDQTTLAPDESINVVHFTENSTELIEPELTTRTLEDELQTVRFRAGGFSIWGVVGSKTHEPQQLTAEAEGVQVLLDAPGRARLPEGARLEAVELKPGSEQYEACYAEAERLLSEEKGEPVSICFARFFDLTILDRNGKELEPSAAVNVSFDYEEQFQLSLGQEMFVVHFADDGAEMIETELSRPVDKNGEEQEGTCVQFQQSSFSITGTVLTEDELVNDDGSIYNGFPTMSAAYYVTFDAQVNGVTKTYAMGYGGVVEEVTRNLDGTITFNGLASSDKTLANEWFNSFVWYYNNFAYISNNQYNNGRVTSVADFYGNFLSNDYPFATQPTGGYQGGIQSLTPDINAPNTSSYGYDFRNFLRYSSSVWDQQNYTYSHNYSNTTSTPQAKYGQIGGLATFICREIYDNDNFSGSPKTSVLALSQIIRDQTDQQNINRAPRSIYIDSSGNVRLAMGVLVKTGINVNYAYVQTAEDNTKSYITVNGSKCTVCDPVLVLDGGYWKWVYPYDLGTSPFSNAIKATNLQFSTGYRTDGIEPAEASSPLSAVLDSYRMDAPEISKTLMPNNGGDGTYSLALSVMGDSHASYSKLMADVLVVADMSNSMKTIDSGSSKTRLQILKDVLGELSSQLLDEDNDKGVSVAMNMMTFGSRAADYNRAWVTTTSGFENYINSLPSVSNLQGATNWEEALEVAYDMLKARREATANDSYRHVQYLVFLTDGDPTVYMSPLENELLNNAYWQWDSNPGSGYYGTGATQPINIYYSLLEARDDARRIVWGIDKNSNNTSGIDDAKNNTHIDPETGKPEPVTTYMYAIATMGNADTLTNLMAYAYNGSLEATYPKDTVIMANSEAKLLDAINTIINGIYSNMSYTNVSIYDPCTEYTHVAAEMDRDPESVYHYYRYRCDLDFNILDDSGNVIFRAVPNSKGVIDHYEDVQHGNAKIENIYEYMSEHGMEWDRTVQVKDYSGGTPVNATRKLEGANFSIKIYRTSDNMEVSIDDIEDYSQVGSDPSQGKPYYYTQVIDWNLSTSQPYTDVLGESTDRFLLEKGYAYTVIVTVWPYQDLYDAIAGLNNGQITWEELGEDIDTRYIHYDDASGTYYYDTNLRDEDENSMATVDYQHYDEYTDPETGDVTINITPESQQFYVNPRPIPLEESEIRMKKTWVDSLDETLLEKLIADAVSAKLEELTGKTLSQMTTAQILALPADDLAELRSAYSAQLVLLSKPIAGEFPSADANVFGSDVEGEWVYYTGDVAACSMFFRPGWHFYGENSGETDANHLGRIVVDQRFTDEQTIDVSAGILVSEANFDPLNNNYGLSKMRLQNPDGSPFGESNYYIIEEGYDYTLREVNSDGTFSLNTEFYHPMLIDGKMYDIEIKSHIMDGDVPYYIATVKNESGTSTLEATNTLRSQLSISKETFEKTKTANVFSTLYQEDENGDICEQEVSVFDQSTTYLLRPMDSFTISVDITLDPDKTQLLAYPTEEESFAPVTELFYIVYPAYLDQMIEEGKITEDQLDRYLTYVIREGGSYQIGETIYTGGCGYFEVRGTTDYTVQLEDGEIVRKFCTRIGADITINANQHIRVYNLPKLAAAELSEVDNPLAWQMIDLDWESPEDGFALNVGYVGDLSNLLLPMDIELKKIGTNEADRDTISLSDETDPAVSGEMYDDSVVTGLPGAKFLLYQQVDPVPVSEMAAKGIVWLLPDGTTTSEGTPENGVQVIPARNYYQEAITLDAATDSDGRLRIRNLLAGTYYLVESQPPVGYHLNDVVENSVRYLTINLSNDGMSYLQPDANGGQTQNALSRLELVDAEHQPVLEMLVINSKPGEALPQTGGPGRKQLSVLGIALVLFGAAALMIRKNRRKEDRA